MEIEIMSFEYLQLVHTYDSSCTSKAYFVFLRHVGDKYWFMSILTQSFHLFQTKTLD